MGVTLSQSGLYVVRHLLDERGIEARKEYPQWERRKTLLRAVHEWFEVQTAIPAQLWYNDLVALAEDSGYEGSLPPPADAEADSTVIGNARARLMNLFVVLVKDSYIDADISTEMVGLPFTAAKVRGLTEKGLRAIGELPDANDEIQRNELDKQRQVQEVRQELVARPSEDSGSEGFEYHVFISHASEDKNAFVEPLAKLLDSMGFQVWYDAFTLRVGQAQHGLLLWAEDVNNTGGLFVRDHGEKESVELVVHDDESTRGSVAARAEELANVSDTP